MPVSPGALLGRERNTCQLGKPGVTGHCSSRWGEGQLSDRREPRGAEQGRGGLWGRETAKLRPEA